MIDNYIRQLLKKFRHHDRELAEALSHEEQIPIFYHNLIKFILFKNTVGSSYTIAPTLLIILPQEWSLTFDVGGTHMITKMESINRKVKDLKYLGREFCNFEHFRNRFLYAARHEPVFNGSSNHNPVLYFDNDDDN